MLTVYKDQACIVLGFKHLSEKLDKGFKDVDNRFTKMESKMDKGFQRLDQWMMILVGAVGLSFVKDDASG